VRSAQQPKASRLDATHQTPQTKFESEKMSIRDRIEDIIWDHCDDGEAFMDAADAILAALPDYDKQQARIAELEAALEWYAAHVADCRKLGRDGDVARGKLDRDGGSKSRAALKGETS
jgi:hypothetical protein